jgi:hypothetical protein
MPRSCRHRELLRAVSVAEQPVIPNALEARRQHVEQEAPEEFRGAERHRLRLRRRAIVLPPQVDLVVDHVDQSPFILPGDATGEVTARRVSALPRDRREHTRTALADGFTTIDLGPMGNRWPGGNPASRIGTHHFQPRAESKRLSLDTITGVVQRGCAWPGASLERNSPNSH